MTRGTRIVAVDADADIAASADPSMPEPAAPPAPSIDEDWIEAEDAPTPPRQWRQPALLALALVLAAGWTAFFAWTNRDAMLAGGDAASWTGWIRDWSVPMVLIGMLWMLAMRSSSREASRFGDAARLLSDESARLEARLITVNRELSLAREFIASQSRDLETLGRVASERLSENARQLAGLIADNGERVELIGTVSAAAVNNMETLRDQLPVVTVSARDLTNNIGNAGRTAHKQLEEMIEGFKRLNQFGQASETQVLQLRKLVDETLKEFGSQTDRFDALANTRFAALAERGKLMQDELDSSEASALEALQQRAAALAAEIAQAREQLAADEATSASALEARVAAIRDDSTRIAQTLRAGEEQALSAWQQAAAQLTATLQKAVSEIGDIEDQAIKAAHDRLQALDNALRSRREEHLAHAAEVASHADSTAETLAAVTARMEEIAARSAATESTIGAGLNALADQLTQSQHGLGEADRAISALTDNSVRLLELIQASVQHSSADLPAAITIGENRLADLAQQAESLKAVVGDAEARGAGLSRHMADSRDALGSSLEELERMETAIGKKIKTRTNALTELRETLDNVRQQSLALAEQAQGELRQAITVLAEEAQSAIASIELQGAGAVSALASRLGEESAAAIDKAVEAKAAEAAGALEQAAIHAAGVSREAAIQLRDQLTKVNELAGNLEQRVAQARRRAEEQVNNDFARRMALITESLNSSAIDIARSLDTEVSDTAWAAYLKGDRGIFTRRAVKLLDAPQAKSVVQLYESDRDFSDLVSRYIHDFEAMLRPLLSTRDGHALGVTLLSSDMGKLYVALAQAIDRLRN